MPKVLRRAVLTAIVLGVALGVGLLTCGFRIEWGADPGPEVTGATVLEERLDLLLRDAVTPHGVDYGKLRARRAAIEALVGDLAVVGPQTRSLLFTTRESRLAYYINAYNALAVFGVLSRDVTHGVDEVRGIIAPRRGFGFYDAMMFKLDARYVNLDMLQNRLIRANFRDARILTALCGATRSSPALRGGAFHAATLNGELHAAARAMVNDPRHVSVRPGARTVWLSALFEIHAKDFAADAKRRGVGETNLDWIAHYAAPPLATALHGARMGGYVVRFLPTDWSLNTAGTPPVAPSAPAP